MSWPTEQLGANAILYPGRSALAGKQLQFSGTMFDGTSLTANGTGASDPRPSPWKKSYYVEWMNVRYEEDVVTAAWTRLTAPVNIIGQLASALKRAISGISSTIVRVLLEALYWADDVRFALTALPRLFTDPQGTLETFRHPPPGWKS